MRQMVPCCLAGLLSVLPVAAHALDCAKATGAIDKAICASPSAKKADDAMAKTFFAVLASISDSDFKAALIVSQRRWLKARRGQDANRYSNKEGEPTLSEDLEYETGEREAFLNKHITGNGKGKLSMVETMEQQRKLLDLYPGEFTGFMTDCFFPSSGGGETSYTCIPVIALQRGDRLCRWDKIFVSPSTEVWTVGDVQAHKVGLLATCKEDYSSGPECPDNDGPGGGWTRTPGPNTPSSDQLATHLKKLDPDLADLPINDRLTECLSNDIFPLPKDFKNEKR